LYLTGDIFILNQPRKEEKMPNWVLIIGILIVIGIITYKIANIKD